MGVEAVRRPHLLLPALRQGVLPELLEPAVPQPPAVEPAAAVQAPEQELQPAGAELVCSVQPAAERRVQAERTPVQVPRREPRREHQDQEVHRPVHSPARTP